MSPSVGIWQRLITVFTSRWFIAIMIPRPGWMRTPSMPARSAIRPAQAPAALTVTRALTSVSSPLRTSRSSAPVTSSPSRWIGHGGVVGKDVRLAAPLGAARKRPHGLPRVDAGVGHPERARDPAVQARLLLERCVRLDLLAVDAGGAAALGEAIGVVRVVVRRRHEQPARVLDAVRDDPAQDPVLDDALLGRLGVLDHVAPARVQQPVEAPARALAQVEPVREHHPQPAQRGVPGHAGARRAAADHEHIRLQQSHSPFSLLSGGRGPSGTARPATAAYSAQSNVRSTAFFQKR